MLPRVQGWVDNDIYPPSFGLSVRVFHLYQALASHAGVTVTCAVKRRSRSAAQEEAGGVHIRRVKPYHPALFYYLEKLRLAPLYLSHGIYRRWPGHLLRACDREANIWQIDSLALTGMFDHAPDGALKVYASQNVEAEWVERVGPPLLAREYWANGLKRIEEEAVAASDLILAVSHRDRLGFLERYGVAEAKVEVIENGYDAGALRPPSPDERSRARTRLDLGGEQVLLFAGSDFLHNQLAVEELFRHVVPRLASLDAKLLLVGGISNRFSGRAQSQGAGRVLCLPPRTDLLEILWASDVGLNPITTGAGSNLKLPTYLGAGLPVLTTPFGARGYERIEDLIDVAPVSDFADRLAHGIHYDSKINEPLATYSWRALGQRLAGLYRQRLGSLANKSPGPGSGEERCAS